MTYASVRLVDRVIVQTGDSLGVRDDCDIVVLTQAQLDALRVLMQTPNGGIALNLDGTLTALPVPPPPPRLPDQDVDTCRGYLGDAQIDALIAADPALLTPAQQVARKNAIALRALIRVTARLASDLR